MSTSTVTNDDLETDTDLGDLDLLDGKIHGYCRACLPSGKPAVEPGDRFQALCGVEAFSWQGEVGDAENIPRAACTACLAFIGKRCPNCGAAL